MLPATPEETQAIIDYMNWQAPDLKVEFLQKVYTENVLSHQHQVWDVHTNVDRWWVITNPTNLYSQEQFPNMDLAVTFHVGLCIRIPRSQKQKLSDLPIEPLAACYRYMTEASDALDHAQEVADYQAIGVRCREALLAFTNAAQIVMPWSFGTGAPTHPHFSQVGRSHSISGCSEFIPLWGDSRCEPHAGQVSGTPRICLITAELPKPIACSTVEVAASASYHLEVLAWVSQLEKFHALSSMDLKR
jgi:hypothetical protein